MSKNRSVQLITNIEQDLADLVWTRAKADNMSMSTYIRGLLIADLKERGVLTPELMEELV